jgi:mRNA degradation ribonuclease J1/J2
MIANYSPTLAQISSNQRLFAEPQNVGTSTNPNRSVGTMATRRVFVRSKSLLVRAAVVEDKLLKRPEFKQLGFVITREESDADLIFELRHDLLTKYVFSVVDAKTQTLLASGKVSSLGGTVAGKIAKRFVKDMARTGTP